VGFRLKRLPLLTLAGIVAIVIAGSGQVAAEDGSPVASPVISEVGLSGAVAWLLTQQGDDGGFTGFSGESDPGITIDAIIALAAARDAGIDSGDAIDRAVEYLESDDVALVYIQGGAGQAAKLVLGLVAVNLDPAEFAMVDALSIVQSGMDGESGIYGTGMFDHALAVLALTATGNDVPDEAIEAFAATQAENGGWAFDASTASEGVDSNTTALGVQALVGAGQGDSDLVAEGLRYLESVWTDGGATYSHAPDMEPDANSTALAIQAFAVAGMDVADRHSTLAMFQNPSGAFHYNAADQSDNLFATVQAIPAMAQAQPSKVATPVSFLDALAA
jgi:hypothetical protein